MSLHKKRYSEFSYTDLEHLNLEIKQDVHHNFNLSLKKNI